MKKIFNSSGIKKVFEKILEPKGSTRVAVCCFLFVLILAIPAIFYEVVYAKTINLGEADDTVYIEGNIGIGTTSPGYKLDVSGTGRFTNPVIVGTPTGDTHAATKSYVDSAAGGGVGAGSSGQTLRHDGTSWVGSSLLYNNGTNVGIGTTSPGTYKRLDIVGVNTGGYSVGIQSTDGGGALEMTTFGGTGTLMSVFNVAGSGNYLQFRVENSAKVTILNNGNVGIGTTTPGSKLELNLASGSLAMSIKRGASSVINLGSGSGSTGDNGILQMFHDGAEKIRLYTTGNSWITGGNVGIGDTTPTYKLDVAGTGRFTSPVIVGTPTGDTHAATKSYVDSAADAIEIGGRNLFLNSSVDDYGLDKWNPSAPSVVDTENLYDNSASIKMSPTTTSGIYSDMFTVQGNRTYTWSFMIKASEAFVPGGGKLLHQQLSQTGSSHYETNTKYYPSTVQANIWTKVYVTFDAPDTYATYGWRGYIWYPTPGEIYYVTNFKLEKGNKPTDWTPAPEDSNTCHLVYFDIGGASCPTPGMLWLQQPVDI